MEARTENEQPEAELKVQELLASQAGVATFNAGAKQAEVSAPAPQHLLEDSQPLAVFPSQSNLPEAQVAMLH